MKNTVFNAIKRKISFVLIIVLVVSSGILSSCSAIPQSAALEINGVEISNDVFTYFLDVALAEQKANAQANASSSEKEVAFARAVQLTETYFKTNSLAKKCGISLSTANKAEVSEKVNAYWSVYGEYYTSIGVSKETLTKVFTADAYKNRLLVFYYGEGGEEEISVASMYAYFKTNYIVFQSINGYLTYMDDSGKSVLLQANQIEELLIKFKNMANLVNAKEKTMEEAADFLAGTGYSSSVITMVLKRDDTSYPAGFFDKVKSTQARVATVIGTNEYIFLVLRGDAGVTSEYYLEKKEEILNALVGDKIDVKIENSIETEHSINSKNAESIYSLIKFEKTGAV